jgi:5-methylcytosine-specific restriction endonuclease McrA
VPRLVSRKNTRLRRLCKEQGWRCHYCGEHFRARGRRPTVDHKVPLCRGGPNRAENVVAACLQCNADKGPLTDAEFRPVRLDHKARKELLRRVSVEVEAGRKKVTEHERARAWGYLNGEFVEGHADE